MGPEYRWLKEDPRYRELSNRCTAGNAPFVHEAIDEWVMSQDSVEEAERSWKK